MRFNSLVVATSFCGLLVASSAYAQVSAPLTTVTPMQTGTTSGGISNETGPRLAPQKSEAEAAEKAKAAEKEMNKAVPTPPPAVGK